MTTQSIMPAKNLWLWNVIGQGENKQSCLQMKNISLEVYLWKIELSVPGQFSLVYKADWFIDLSRKPTTVAVKTLKVA